MKIIKSRQTGAIGRTLDIVHHGRYICAESSGVTVCNRTWCREWEHFISIPIGVNQVALKSHHNKYLSAKSDGKIDAKASQIGASEKFEIIDCGSGKFGLKSSFNKYLSAQPPQNNPSLQCNRDKLLGWEQFEIVVFILKILQN